MNIRSYLTRGLGCAALLSACAVSTLQAAESIAVNAVSAAPVVDGDLGDWGNDWQSVSLHKAVAGDKKVSLESLDVEIQAVSDGQKIYFALRWPDASEDKVFRPWVWNKKSYKRSNKQLDDMLALRFDRGLGFDECMVADLDYEVDVWLWSAGRSNLVNRALNTKHIFSTSMLDSSVESTLPSGKQVYFQKQRKSGEIGFSNAKFDRKTNVGEQVLSVVLSEPSGNQGNVAAQGVWRDGYWQLELSRELQSGAHDDVAFTAGQGLRTQIAVFDSSKGSSKLVSKILMLQLP